MLILNRRVGQIIRIDEDIVIKVLSQNVNDISIGIKAPKSMTILREEIYQKELSSSSKNELTLFIEKSHNEDA